VRLHFFNQFRNSIAILAVIHSRALIAHKKAAPASYHRLFKSSDHTRGQPPTPPGGTGKPNFCNGRYWK
jgi:hypothetical protein